MEQGCGRKIFDFLFVQLPIWVLRFVLLLVVVVAPFVKYGMNKRYLVYTQPLLFPGVVILGLGLPILSWIVLHRHPALSKKYFTPLVLGGGLLLLLAQVFLIRGGLFETGWDPGSVAIVGSRINDESLSYLRSYLSLYPNNASINLLFSFIAAAGSLFGITPYVSLVLGGCLCVTISIVACTFAARRLFDASTAIAFDVFASLYIGLNAWIYVPYTDTYGMLCPALMLLCIVCVRDIRLKALTVGILAALGYVIKPTAIFPLFACVLFLLPRLLSAARIWLEQLHNSNAKDSLHKLAHSHLMQAVCCGLLAFVVSWGSCLLAASAHCASIGTNPSKAVGITHFLMMGSNAADMGGFSSQDVNFSQSFDDPNERSRANLEEWANRLQEMGPFGTAKLAVRKTLTNFADGTFAWECEGGFYKKVIGQSDAIKAWYGIGDKSVSLSVSLPYELFCQTCWLVVLVGCACAPRNGGSQKERCIRLALLMLTVFLMIFEARARYLFLFAPYFVLLGVVGWFRIEKALRMSMQKRMSITEGT